jgi:hypothetical protein
VPNLAAVVHVNGDALPLPQDGQFQAAPQWIAPRFAGLFESGGRYFIGANVCDQSTGTFAYLPLDQKALALLTAGIVSVSGVLPEEHLITTFTFGPSGSRTFVIENAAKTVMGRASDRSSITNDVTQLGKGCRQSAGKAFCPSSATGDKVNAARRTD